MGVKISDLTEDTSPASNDWLETEDVSAAASKKVLISNIMKIAGLVLPQSLMSGTGTSWAWQSFVPSWTSSGVAPAVGNATLEAKYIQIGKTIFFRIRFISGSTTTYGTGSYYWSLPVTAANTVDLNSFPPIGHSVARDVSIGSQFMGMVSLNSTTKLGWGILHSIAANGAVAAEFGDGTFPWATSDKFECSGVYECV
jgi:hypothetical protein